MKKYIATPYGFFKHSIKITFQKGDFKGDIIRKAGGNVVGRSIILAASECEIWDSSDIEHLEENNCQMTIDDDQNWFGMVLKDDKGNKLQINDTLDSLEDMVVAIEIVDWLEDN